MVSLRFGRHLKTKSLIESKEIKKWSGFSFFLIEWTIFIPLIVLGKSTSYYRLVMAVTLPHYYHLYQTPADKVKLINSLTLNYHRYTIFVFFLRGRCNLNHLTCGNSLLFPFIKRVKRGLTLEMSWEHGNVKEYEKNVK